MSESTKDPWSEEPDVTDPELDAFTEMHADMEAEGATSPAASEAPDEISTVVANEATAARIQFAFACGLEHVMQQQSVSPADVVLAFRDALVSMINHYTVKEASPIVAHANRASLLQMIDAVRAHLAGLELPAVEVQ